MSSVHVRRTDKIGSEAAFHDISEYMRSVEEYFDVYDLMQTIHHQQQKTNKTKTIRNVYLATDDVNLHAEAMRKYPQYNFIFEKSNSESANLNRRYSPESALGIIKDIHFLSNCDYLVCTFSSGVGRLAYELMQAKQRDEQLNNEEEDDYDTSWRFRSLDDVYYFNSQREHDFLAILDHQPQPQSDDEIELNAGDIIYLLGDHWNGRSIGVNRRTKKKGFFPSYKIRDLYRFF